MKPRHGARLLQACTLHLVAATVRLVGTQAPDRVRAVTAISSDHIDRTLSLTLRYGRPSPHVVETRSRLFSVPTATPMPLLPPQAGAYLAGSVLNISRFAAEARYRMVPRPCAAGRLSLRISAVAPRRFASFALVPNGGICRHAVRNQEGQSDLPTAQFIKCENSG